MSDVFIPTKSATISLSASSASAALDPTAPQVRLYNGGDAVAQVRWGKGAQTAVTTDLTLAPGAVECFGKQDADTLAAVGTSGTLYITSGTGA